MRTDEVGKLARELIIHFLLNANLDAHARLPYQHQKSASLFGKHTFYPSFGKFRYIRLNMHTRSRGFAGLARSLPSESWTKRVIRLRRDLSVQLRSSPNLVYTAVQRTLKPLKFIIPHALGMQHWLLRWCH
ncbi:uncharacterized protein TNCT_136581 [Trichonephila clavata]|uniref:Uncharacterized protein n=1 Tax=Trichonephila clavata TaxID=2740835 RepID=A0A8X6HGL5_TRICU|nr:uncharacterized protein TNCT_136581 [Trichonephila clavata]